MISMIWLNKRVRRTTHQERRLWITFDTFRTHLCQLSSLPLAIKASLAKGPRWLWSVRQECVDKAERIKHHQTFKSSRLWAKSVERSAQSLSFITCDHSSTMAGSAGCASCRVCLQFLGFKWNSVWRTIRDPNFSNLWMGMPQKRTTRCHLLSASSYTPPYSLHPLNTCITPLLNRLWPSNVFLSVASESAKVTWQQTQSMRLARLNMMLSCDCACPAFSHEGQT